MLTDPSTDSITDTSNQHVQRSIGEICYHNLRQYYYNFIVLIHLLIYGLFNVTINSSVYTVSDYRMTSE
jgi:hypothetical protein